MPDGRFLSKTVAHDWELNTVSLEADYLFTRCIPHLDVEGRLGGHPGEVRGLAVPLREEFTVEVVDRCLGELAKAGLVTWYQVEGRPILQFPGFSTHQKGLRKDREAASKHPSPQVHAAQRILSVLRNESGATPEDSGSTPAKVSEVKGSEVKGRGSEVPVSKNPDNPARGGESSDQAPVDPSSGSSDGLVGMVQAYPAAGAVLREIVHQGGKNATARVIESAFLFPDGQGELGEACVRKLPLEERQLLVASALLDYGTKGEPWDRPYFAGFVKRAKGRLEAEKRRAEAAGEEPDDGWVITDPEGRRIDPRTGRPEGEEPDPDQPPPTAEELRAMIESIGRPPPAAEPDDEAVAERKRVLRAQAAALQAEERPA